MHFTAQITVFMYLRYIIRKALQFVVAGKHTVGIDNGRTLYYRNIVYNSPKLIQLIED